MKLAGCFNGTKTSYMPKDQGKFDFSCHDDPFTGQTFINMQTQKYSVFKI